jgi:hypothetical protein
MDATALTAEVEEIERELQEQDERFLTPEEIIDRYHPQSDPFSQGLNSLRAQLTTLEQQLGPRRMRVVRLLYAGETNKAIAKQTGYTQASVSKIKNHPLAVEAVYVLARLGDYIEGPSKTIRKAMTWRIAVDNEKNDPNTALRALQELNRLEGAYPKEDAPSLAPVNITINAEMLPKTSLDQLPRVLEHAPE